MSLAMLKEGSGKALPFAIWSLTPTNLQSGQSRLWNILIVGFQIGLGSDLQWCVLEQELVVMTAVSVPVVACGRASVAQRSVSECHFTLELTLVE